MSDGDITITELTKTKDSSISIGSRSHSTFGSIFTWLKKRRKVIGSYQSQSEDDIGSLDERSSPSPSLSTVKMNDSHSYSSSTSSKNSVDGDNNEAAMSASEEDRLQPQSYKTDDETDDALDDSLSTVKMSELVLSSSKPSVQLVHEALEYERCLRTQTARKI